jgi:hypothetical protein
VTATKSFAAFGIWEHVRTAGLMALVTAILWALTWFSFQGLLTGGTPIKAEVLRVATYPAGKVAGGELPILTVRLPDGSTREVLATWPDVDNCAPGGWISLVQQGRALQVGPPGCNNAQ